MDKKLAPVLLLVVLLRLAAAVYLGDTLAGAQQRRIYDQVSYDALARSLLSGKGYSFDQDWYPFTPAGAPTAHWSFLYPLYLAGVYAVAGTHPLAARLLQALLAGCLSTWLLYRLGSRLAGRRAGLLSAVLGAVYLYFIYHDAALMTEAFFIPAVLAMLNLAMQIAGIGEAGAHGEERDRIPAAMTHSRHSLAPWFWLGVVLGLAALLRQAILLWLPFLLGWLLWSGPHPDPPPRSGPGWGPALLVAVMAFMILPWTARNFAVYHRFLLLNSNAGYALYASNHPHHTARFDPDFAAPLPLDLAGRGLNEAEWDSALTRRGLQMILPDPAGYLRLSLNRVAVYFNFWFSPESDTPANLARLLSFGLYLPGFVYGLLISLQHWRRYALIYLFVLVYSALHILTWAGIRYRLPVDAALMPLGALALLDITARLKKLGRQAGPRFPLCRGRSLCLPDPIGA